MPKLRPNQFYLPSGYLITELPILMQTEMVQATLADRKTQTRRTKGLSLNVNGKPKDNWIYTECFLGIDTKWNDAWMAMAVHTPTKGNYSDNCPYGKPGDLLWVKESFTKTPDFGYAYKANLSADSEDLRKDYLKTKGNEWAKWKSSFHMPKSAARIWLMVEDIRVERVQEISEEDAKAEGVEEISSIFGYSFPIYKDYKGFMHDGYQYPPFSFSSLWRSINGEESWLTNPWVWVIKFRVLSKVGKPSVDVIEKNYLEVTGKEANHG